MRKTSLKNKNKKTKNPFYFSNINNQHAAWMNSEAIKSQWHGDSREGQHS